MKLVITSWRKIIFGTYLFFSPFLALAQSSTVQSTNGAKLVNPIQAETLNGFIKTLLEGVLRIGIPIVALAIIYCGFLFVSARGNSEKISTAKDALLYTLIGAAILLGSWAIAQLVSDTVLAL